MANHDGGRRRAPWLGLDPATVRVAWTLLAIGAVLALLYILRYVLLLLAFSVFFAYLLYPVVHAGQRWVPGLRSRTRAIVVVYLALLAILVVAGAQVGPRLATEVRALAEKLPEMSRQWGSGASLGELLQKVGLRGEIAGEIEGFIKAHAGEIIAYTQSAAAAVVRWVVGAWVIVLIPVFAFFILKDAEVFVEAATGLFEYQRQRQRSLRIGEDLHHLLGEYMRALTLLSLITFVAWSLVFLIVQVPYPLLLAALGGACEAIPLLGPVVAGIVVVAVAQFTGYGHALPLVLFLVIWRVVQDYVSNPLVMGRGVAIHPALVIFGVLAGGEIAGPIGMFLSVPAMAFLRILWRHAREARQPTSD